ncbi:hypothetical protein [Deinococcus radiodurans]|uniref:hypothetical protein n=1 Tax=Deinococcus radiodurans TaxID=1299 RepID=UPI00138E0066|nr:hypothetical protein [Deinococcus radiodurans]QIP30461.1 hypothetical protein HAV23_14540 [Deinococcus radiodurans]QIP33179.1 hypothetical protein HAV35_13450 [Deinococcus radiodurans]UTA52256.1 hypothetical protein MSS93_14685 [Deinococcus radiodurans]
MYYTVWFYIRKPSKLSNMRNVGFSRAQEIFGVGMIIGISVCNIWLISNIVPYYGGVGGALNNMGAADIVTFLQRDGPDNIRKLIFVNFFLPVVVVPVILMKRKEKYIILALGLGITFFLASLYGARTLFLEPLLSCIIVLCTRVSLSARKIASMLFLAVSIFIGMSYLQAIRFGERGIIKGSEILLKYYTISLNQGANIIVGDLQREPLYWTFSSLFGLPIINNLLGFRAVYEGLFGSLPIQSREDDFNYVAALGADPGYNTLGIYAYMQLDAGLFGILLILLVFIISSYLYNLFYQGSQMGILLFPAAYILLLDQLRTAGMFSARMPYFFIAAVTIYCIGRVSVVRRVDEKF